MCLRVAVLLRIDVCVCLAVSQGVSLSAAGADFPALPFGGVLLPGVRGGTADGDTGGAAGRDAWQSNVHGHRGRCGTEHVLAGAKLCNGLY